MDANQYKIFRQNVTYLFKGNIFAVELAMDIIYVIDLWDDLIDKDKVRTNHDINLAFKTLFHKLPTNPFYKANEAQLIPIIMNSILKWEDANILEKGSDDDKNKAYMLQAGLYDLFSYIALLVGGYEWVAQIGPDIRRSYCEKLDKYKEEHK